MPTLTAVNKSPASVTANKPASSSGASDAQATDLFGALLAQQVADIPSNTHASAPSQPANLDDKKNLADKKTAADKLAEQQSISAATVPADLTGNLIALLPPSPEIRTTVTTAEARPVRIDTGKVTPNTLPTSIINVDAEKNVANSTTAIATERKEVPLSNNSKSAVQNAPEIRTDKPGAAPIVAAKTEAKSPAESDTKFITPVSKHGDIAAAPVAPGTQDAISTVVANMQHSLNTSPAQMTATAQQSIATAVGSNHWAEEFSQKITWMTTQQNNQVAELHLNPPDLGPLNVVLKVTDNQATATFISSHSAVRDAVTHALPALREVLANSGITLGNTTVSDQPARDNSAAFSGQQQQSRQWVNQGGTPNEGAVQAISTRVNMRKHDGMVDTFA
ncbi:MAG: flagellar hook-length control protein FliK [Gallionella sp.]